MNDKLVKALDPQLAQIALNKIANHKVRALGPQLPFVQLVKKIHQENITRAHIDRHKINAKSTLSSSINNISLDVDNLTVEDILTIEHDIAYEINVIKQKYSNDPNIKGETTLPHCL